MTNHPASSSDRIEKLVLPLQDQRELSEELSNATTSSTSISTPTEIADEESNSSIEFSCKYAAGTKRPRKSAELARKRIKQDITARLGSHETDSPAEQQNNSRENSCEKSECQLDAKCVINLSQNCSNNTKIAFLHISKREHVCQLCYEEFKMGKPMFDRYKEWKGRWVERSRCVPFLRMFIFEEFLPFWLNCSACGKFRRIVRSMDSELSPTIIAKFKCAHAFPPELEDACSLTEESDVLFIRATPTAYIRSLEALPLLQHSPAIYFLQDHYYSDELGISPINAHFEYMDCLTTKFMRPFNIPDEQSKAFSLRPDVMEFDEVLTFPEFASQPGLYLAMRNLVLALWNLNPFEYLGFAKCFAHLICPSLARIWFSAHLERVIDYLTLKNIINYGIIPIPANTLLSRKKARRLEVIVVGGGISGLGAARQLRSMGAKVALLEAKSKLGGRMQDDWTLGVAVGCGAQLVTGIVNNPIIVMCEQIDHTYRLLSDACPLLDAKRGRLVRPVADRIVDEHFNCLLDIIGHWKNEENARNDVSLLSQINELHATLLKHIDFRWATEFDRLLQWQIGNVEFSCGALLSEVSAKHWDQNESVGQFSGAHALLSQGSDVLIKRLAEGVDVRCGHQVVEVNYSGPNKVLIKCENGKQFICDKLLLCLPLTQYQREKIQFIPELPVRKKTAYNALGCGLIEKIAVRFPYPFWKTLLKSDGTIDYFGHVPKSVDSRGLFNMFYDFSTKGNSPKKQHQNYVLMSYVCGQSVELVNQKNDAEVVAEFVDTLQKLFPNQTIPAPINYLITHWGRDQHIGMSYSFVKLGATGEDYDELARSVDQKLYFAGECTNRFFPQTMTGAYVSAMRECSKIAEDWLVEGSSG